MARPWNWPAAEADPEAGRLRDRYGMPPAVARILARRGLLEDDILTRFLNPRLGHLVDPMVLADMERGVERLWRAIDAGETIFVHGDYDVDGITGTAFLTRTLRSVGGTVVPFVPRRADGYGVGDAGIAAAVEVGARVLITVDTGVRAHEAVARARAEGLDVVILDHHQLAETLPEAYAIINPLRGNHGPAYDNLAAVGVAAKFMHAMGVARPSPELRTAYREALQLVALGTIADVVPLTGENRILVAHGLLGLQFSEWAGIKALKAVAGLRSPRISSTDVAFFLAPRINAAGRMGEARDALDLLLCDDPAEAFRLAERIEGLNAERRKVERGVLAEAVDHLKTGDEVPPAIVQWSDSWPVGVIGIVASRLLERFHRPTFLIAMDGDTGRGSCRSTHGFPLPAALEACDDLLVQHGGHAPAAGFEIRREYLEAFRERIESRAANADLDGDPIPLDVDVAVGLDEVDADCVGWIEKLSPFGKGNPEPLFGCEGMVLAEEPSVVGKRHLSLRLSRDTVTLRGIAFNLGNRVAEFERGRKVDAVFHASFDTWRGGKSVQLVVRDLRVR